MNTEAERQLFHALVDLHEFLIIQKGEDPESDFGRWVAGTVRGYRERVRELHARAPHCSLPSFVVQTGEN